MEKQKLISSGGISKPQVQTTVPGVNVTVLGSTSEGKILRKVESPIPPEKLIPHKISHPPVKVNSDERPHSPELKRQNSPENLSTRKKSYLPENLLSSKKSRPLEKVNSEENQHSFKKNLPRKLQQQPPENPLKTSQSPGKVNTSEKPNSLEKFIYRKMTNQSVHINSDQITNPHVKLLPKLKPKIPEIVNPHEKFNLNNKSDLPKKIYPSQIQNLTKISRQPPPSRSKQNKIGFDNTNSKYNENDITIIKKGDISIFHSSESHTSVLQGNTHHNNMSDTTILKLDENLKLNINDLDDEYYYKPTSRLGIFLAKYYTKLEKCYPMGPSYKCQNGCSEFTTKVLLLLGLKMIFPTSCSIILTYFMKPENGIIETLKNTWWITFIAIFCYGALYGHLRIVGPSYQHKHEICLFDLSIFTLCEMYIVGILTIFLPFYTMMMISITMTITCLTIAYCSWAINSEVRGSYLYIQMLPIILLYSGSITITICLFVDKPGHPINLTAMGNNFATSCLCSIVMFTAIYFELQRLMAGRRISLIKMDYMDITWAVLIIPVSILYPSYLLRKGQTCTVFPAKVHPSLNITIQEQRQGKTRKGKGAGRRQVEIV